jgi:hypothetical protein
MKRRVKKLPRKLKKALKLSITKTTVFHSRHMRIYATWPYDAFRKLHPNTKKEHAGNHYVSSYLLG